MESQSTFAVYDTATCTNAVDVTIDIDSDTTTSSGYGVTISAANTVAPGVYHVHYCDAQKYHSENGDENAGTNDFYKLTEFKYGGTSINAGGADKCSDKCSAGCNGANCGGCDEYLADSASLDANTVCVDLLDCEQLCQNTGPCVGYFQHRSANLCVLVSAFDTPPASNADWDQFTARDSTVCTTGAYCNADFSTAVGTVHVTNKAYVGVDYVVAPQTSSVIEVLGSNLDVNHDRIMVIDCQGTCGLSAASGEALSMFPGGDEGQAGLLFPPINQFIDPPVGPDDSGAATYPHVTWTRYDDQYCGSNQLVNSAAEQYQLFDMCSSACKGGSDCDACTAFNAHWDGSDAPTYGLTLSQAKAACQYTYEVCSGFEYDASNKRVHFNSRESGTGSCADQVASHTTYPSNDYHLYMMSFAENSRRLSGTDFINVPEYDFGFSWSSMLRFYAVGFSSGGTFKVCLCDHDLGDAATANVACSHKSHYSIEVGTVHSSGLECLISQSQFQRGTCEKQFPFEDMDTGVRCYGQADPPTITAPFGRNSLNLATETVTIASADVTAAFGTATTGIAANYDHFFSCDGADCYITVNVFAAGVAGKNVEVAGNLEDVKGLSVINIAYNAVDVAITDGLNLKNHLVAAAATTGDVVLTIESGNIHEASPTDSDDFTAAKNAYCLHKAPEAFDTIC